MGAESFIEIIDGQDAGSCFARLVRAADVDYGTMGYNGSINTCDIGSCKKRYEKYSKQNEKEALRLIEHWNNGDKWTADYIDMGPISYKVITFKKQLFKSNPKYKLSFVVNKVDNFGKMRMVQSFKTKTDADTLAIKLSKDNIDFNYCVNKEYVLVDGNATVTEIKKEIKNYKTKPKLKEIPNRIIIPIHRYIFFGWASN